MDELELARARRNALRREQYRLDGGKRKVENQAWKDAHRDQVRAASREYQRLKYASDPEHAKKVGKKSYVKHRAKRIAETKKWFERHPGYSGTKRAEYIKKDPVRYMLHGLKARTKKSGMEFSLSREDITIPDVCPVLGIELAKGNCGFFASSPSVDRMDSAKGYIPGNVQVISWRANALKRDGTLDEFRRIVAYMERL